LRRIWRWLAVCVVAAGLIPLLPVVVVAEDAVVSSCTEAGFDAALATAQADGGMTSSNVLVNQTMTMCGNFYTGQLRAPAANGSCPSGNIALTLPSPNPIALCINPYTGALIWTAHGTCAGSYRTHIVPDDGPLAYCESLYTGKLRYAPTGQCNASERPGVIPG